LVPPKDPEVKNPGLLNRFHRQRTTGLWLGRPMGHVIYSGPVDLLEESDHPHIQEFLDKDRVSPRGI
jgi:hypothetical protein